MTSKRALPMSVASRNCPHQCSQSIESEKLGAVSQIKGGAGVPLDGTVDTVGRRGHV